MTVKELIEELEKIENKDFKVIAGVWETDDVDQVAIYPEDETVYLL